MAAPPNITRISPPALLSRGTSRIVVEGSNLNDSLRLVLPFDVADQKILGTPAANRVELEVTAAEGTAAGLFPLRVATRDGISSAMIVSVDKIATLPFTDKIAALPVALFGDLPGAQVLRTSFQGQKDQKLVLEVEAKRLGSQLNPTVRLYDPHGRQIAWSPPRDEAGDDARCEVTLPVAGEYQIELHDHLYKGAAPATFRLKIGDFAYAGTVLPLAVQAGTKVLLKPLLSNSQQTWEIDLPATALGGEIGVHLPGENASGLQPRLRISDVQEYKGTLPADAKVPLGISALTSADGKEQTYRMQVTPGKNLRFDLAGHRWGSPIDAVLTIRGEKGNQLATNDDRADSRDPYLEYAVPGNVSTIVAVVKDMSARSGPDYFYRLEVRELGTPEVNASLDLNALQVPAGGSLVVPVTLQRQAYNGPVVIEAADLPAGVTFSALQVPEGASQALLAFQAPADATASGTFSLSVRTADSGVSRRVLFGTHPAAKTMPWLRYEAGLAITKPTPIQLTWQLVPPTELVAGTKYVTGVTLTRQAGTKGKVRLRLLTTQPMPTKKVKDKVVNDIERAIRLEGTPLVAEDATTAEATIILPGELPNGLWDLALVAELLSADGKSVLASTASAAHRFQSVPPFKLELVGEPKGEGRAGLGETSTFTGKLQRSASFTQPITITLLGLPKEMIAPQVVVPGDKSDFNLPLQFPFGTKPGELKNVKLVALIEPGNPASAGKNAIPIALNIVAGEKPPAEEPLVIFDENETFVAQLTEGAGAATVESGEKYSGKIAVKVTPDQKFNAALPGLGVKIRENPGPGEYRYLRFAWKKNGGDTIVLQLNHDGQWGPTANAKAGAKFRYHAGPGGEQFTASLELADTLPAEFEVVTRDLFADFGEFTFSGIALSPVDGAYAVFDHLYLGRSVDDFALAKTGSQ